MLWSKLIPFRRGGSSKGGGQGFVYVRDDEDDLPMRRAEAGAVIRVAGRGPPWIVVNQDPASAIVAKWPGRLWRVEIVDAATSADQRAHGGPPRAYARYTRAVAVKVVQEEDPAKLFGPHGAGVLQVLQAASRLEKSMAEALASNRDPAAPEACDRVWRAWMKDRGVTPDHYPEPLDGTLSLGSFGSPLNSGLSVLYRVVFDRASEIEGEAATASDDEDVWLLPPWDGASAALSDAALALGAPTLATTNDREILMRAWKSAYS